MSTLDRTAVIVALAGSITILHYVTDPHAANIHEMLQRAYYLPIVLGGLWFGAKGGLLTAFLITAAYLPHAIHGWHGPTSLFFRMTEICMFHVFGGVTGWLASQLQAALGAEREARREREAAYEGLRERTEELFRLEEQLRRSDRLAALGQLSAGLAHEIRNPLGSIKTSVELLRDRDKPSPAEGEEQAPDFHQIILEETERLDRIVTSFLDFVRQEKGRPDGDAAHCQVYEVMQTTRELLAPHLEKRGIIVGFPDGAKSLPEAAIPPTFLRQVLLNLFLNAMEVLQEGGKITVTARKENDKRIVIFVDDTGPGIREEIADRIFDPFFSTREQGTGLGLSIVERILHSHGGSISLDRERMPSSRFRIELPIHRDEVRRES